MNVPNGVFFGEIWNNLDELTETVTDYINFCVETVVPNKTVKIFGNNKPWVTKELKMALNENKKIFHEGD